MPVTSSTQVAVFLVVVKFFNDILPISAQVSNIPGDGIDNSFSTSHVRSAWIALWILWIIWALLTLFKWASKETKTRNAHTADRQDASLERGERGSNSKKGGITEIMNHGPRRAARISRDLLLGLLSALVINTFGRGPGSGSGRAVEILTWIFFGLAIIWILVEIAMDNKIIRLLFGFVEYGILLVIFILAYTSGWKLFGR
ncbi:14740_t:CDS:2 [Funneliformis geosporum]|uniref:17621_t:CDS:1 n=1 Tax=Funneliformis geosporum TaxID=1117311 RepID=A0A9W4SKM8_9GLOM|nr:17621_t:CDS:2 [Funneliformis geosporum]CAI2188679.1 14740_t:CDS:2 [Funneliformis geosporum]